MEDNIKYTLEDAQKLFNSFGLTYNLDSVMFMADHGKTPNDLRSDSNIKNIVLLVQSGVADRDIAKAKNIIDIWMDHEMGLVLLHSLIIDRMEKRHFFTDTSELTALMEMMNTDTQKVLVLNNVIEGIVAIQKQGENMK